MFYGEKRIKKKRDCLLLDYIVGDKVKGLGFCNCVNVGDLVTIGDTIKLENIIIEFLVLFFEISPYHQPQVIQVGT